ncbi:MAG: NAD-dependent epimerase/dehydratase family protein [Alphaproteobacteria bacterium]
MESFRDMKVNNIVLLGCGGFIGSHLLDRLLTDGGYDIAGWDFSSNRILGHLDNSRFTFHQADAFSADEAAELETAIKHADVVISLTAICNPARYNTEAIATINANFTEIQKLAESCARHKTWIIHASTCEVYGRTMASYLPDNSYDDPALYEQIEDETPLIMGPIQNQRWSYACAKQLSERLLHAYHTEQGLPVTMFRPYNFVGPRMDFIPGRTGSGVPRVFACFVTALLDGTPMKLVDGGHARRAYLYIDDAVDALERMIQLPEVAQNQTFNLGAPRNETSTRDLAIMIRNAYAEVSGIPAYRTHPIIDVSGLEFYGKGYEDCDRRVPNVAKAQRLLGWEAKYGLDDAVRHTVRYFYEGFGQVLAAAE